MCLLLWKTPAPVINMGRTRKADLARSELAKEAAKLKVDLQTGESPALQSLDQPADDLAREMEKLKIKNYGFTL